jgi:D-alanine transaminase
MSRIAYVNGRYVPHRQACVHIEDRGFQFADAVYEYFAVFEGRLADAEGHIERLWRSLGELRIERPMSEAALSFVLRETIRRNRVRDGAVYLQVSRGVARRDHPFPAKTPPPTVVVTAKPVDYAAEQAKAAKGIKVLTRPDNRWGRCDIKTVGLLPNVLAKQAAREAGAYEAWLVDELGFVTEGASTNAWIVTETGALVTRPADHSILHGVTRATLIDVAAQLGLRLELRPFSLAEAFAASEAFYSSASTIAMPVIEIDGHAIGGGRPGEVVLALRRHFHEVAAHS